MAKGGTVGTASDESVRAFLKEALEHLLAAGHSTHELVEFSIDRFGRKIVPYLKELQDDVHQGRVKIQRLADSVNTAVFGIQVTPEQREQMIRDAAYLRAEKRDFSGGSEEDDWLWAEHEVDVLLANQNGLLEKGRKNLESVSAVAKNELIEVEAAVRDWIKTRAMPEKKAG